MDELLKRLKQLSVGCRICNKFLDNFTIADDMTLDCPSIHGIQKMIDVCKTFADEYKVMFNAKKTVCSMGHNL